MRRSVAVVSVGAAALLAGALVEPRGAVAQSSWYGGSPVFDSDLRRQAEQEEARRAERRQNYGPVVYPKFMDGGERPDIKPVAPPIVYFDRNEEVGSIIIDTQNRKLYFVLPNKQAFEYPISVGRDGFTWTGTERVSRIAAWPSWTPPPEMHKRQPGLPITVSGGLRNPQGARALYLGNTIYRIHGTNNDRTVGRANSSGCFRLTNEHVVHLASIAKVGTKVKVLQTYTGGVSQAPPMPSLFGGLFASEEPPKPSVGMKGRPSAKKPATKTAGVAPARQTTASPASSQPAPAAATAPPTAVTAPTPPERQAAAE